MPKWVRGRLRKAVGLYGRFGWTKEATAGLHGLHRNRGCPRASEVALETAGHGTTHGIPSNVFQMARLVGPLSQSPPRFYFVSHHQHEQI